MYNYPLPQDIPPAHYFLETINNPVPTLIIRVALGLAAVIFVVAYIHIKRKNKKEDEEKK